MAGRCWTVWPLISSSNDSGSTGLKEKRKKLKCIFPEVQMVRTGPEKNNAILRSKGGHGWVVLHHGTEANVST